MSESRITPGPWEVLANDLPKYFPKVRIGALLPYPDGSGDYKSTIVVNVGVPPGQEHGVGTTMETALANARAIAKVPEAYGDNGLVRRLAAVSKIGICWTPELFSGFVNEAVALIAEVDKCD